MTIEPIKGKWIKQTLAMPLSDSTKDCVMCSNCKTRWDMDCNFNFCPNCGADMRGDNDD